MGKSAKQVIRLSPDVAAIVAARASARGVSLSVATDELVMVGHKRLEAVRKDQLKRKVKPA